MTTISRQRVSRRKFLVNTTALSTASFLGLRHSGAAEPPPETTKVRLSPAPVLCTVSMLLAEELLRLEGFLDIQFVNSAADNGLSQVASNQADFAQWDVAGVIPMLDTDAPILILAGLHTGCQELFANEQVRSIRDLKGRRIAISAMGNGDHIFISSILAHVGIDPRKDVTWVLGTDLRGSTKLFIDGDADAFMAFAPEPYDLRREKIGHVIVNLLEDKPWSQYFCCVLAANRKFVHAYPVATKRVVRAILKATDICASDPERAARYMQDKGLESRYDVAVEILRTLPYSRWREADPEDTLRFHALRLYEVGMIKNNPQKLIARGTDWRFLNGLKRELKA